MKKFDPKKVLDFLIEVHSLTKNPVQMHFSPLRSKHNVSANIVQVMLEKNVIRITKEYSERKKVYQWSANTPPNITLVNMLIFRMQELNREYMIQHLNNNKKNKANLFNQPKKQEEKKPILPFDIYNEYKSREKNLKECLWDGKKFVPFNKNNKFCCDDCRTLYHRFKLNNDFAHTFGFDEKANEEKKPKVDKKILKEVEEIGNLMEAEKSIPVAKKKSKGFSILWGAIKVNW